jgi:hypothetical protein
MKPKTRAELLAEIRKLEAEIRKLETFECDRCREYVCKCDGDWSPYMQAYYHLPAQIAELRRQLAELV